MSDGPCDRREACVLALTGIFVLVSIVAYADYPRTDPSPELDPLERAGLAVWRGKGCQSCHQLHGFGGFLGPDLTNRVGEDTPDDEIASIVTSGNGMMPAFRLSPDEQEALVAYLRAMNRTGVSRPPPPKVARQPDRTRHFLDVVNEAGLEVPSPVRRGCDVWTAQGCGACHVPFDLGRNLAPDVTAGAVDRSLPALKRLLARSRGRMPAFTVSDADLSDLAAFLTWTAECRGDLSNVNNRLQGRVPFSWGSVPWFEYPR